MSAKKHGSINLTALGTAAVVAVYAAGYLRTQPAALKHEGSDSARRPAPAVVAVASTSPSLTTDSASTLVLQAKKPAKASPVPSVKKPKAAAPAAAPVTTAAAEPTTPEAPPAAAAPVVEPAKPAADTVKKLRDGTYSGWGTSRHGDIEAAVDIKEGRIVNAYITQCLTRYSCSRIASIIPQVVERQSPEVDYVSGATQSTDAFYYAIVEALKKAKT